jgi:hypothetical protein
MNSHEYEIVIEDGDGRRLRTVSRTTLAGRPVVGDEVVVDGKIYTVLHVRHEQADGKTMRVYTWPRLFVQAKRPKRGRL